MENQASVISFDAVEIENSESDECSSTSTPNTNQNEFKDFTRNGMIRLEQGEDENDTYSAIRDHFMSGLGEMRRETSVVAIHKNPYSGFVGQARKEAFRVFSEAVKRKSGDANVKHGWYGESKEEIFRIVSHGFSTTNAESYGVGVYLFPPKFSVHGANLSVPDEDGTSHVLLCRVILGNTELIFPGSKQSHPSSKEFDSGVDNLSEPTKYIVWGPYMNSHVYPTYVISFRTHSPFRVVPRMQAFEYPKSPWMRLHTLVDMLSRFLDPRKMELVARYHTNFKEKKLSRPQLIQKIRHIAGDDVLRSVIKYCKNNQH